MGKCLDAVLSGYEGKQDELIPILQEVQAESGYLPKEAMLRIAQFTRVPERVVRNHIQLPDTDTGGAT